MRVMTYSSFVSVFGPGAEIKKAFEKICSCRLKWIKVPDSTLFVQRLSLKEDGFKTDVVLGLDQLSLRTAEALPWKKVQVKPDRFILPARKFLSDKFVPYDWSPMSFLSREKKETFQLKDLLKADLKNKISLPSPRTSTVGFQFYYWVWLVFKEKTDAFLRRLKNQLYGLPPSWSTSYALFQRGHVQLSFSYLSSLLYHREQNQKDFYFVPFKEGHPFQVELAGVSGFCTQCELGRLFIHFLLELEIQNIFQKKNYMFPVVQSAQSTQSAEFKDFLFRLKLIQYDRLNIFLEHKKKWLDKWDESVK